MTATAQKSSIPLLDGPHRGLVVGIIFVALSLMAIDGLVTWNDAHDAKQVIDAVADDVAGGIDDRGLLLDESQRRVIADHTDGTRLDNDRITVKTWLAVGAVIAAVSLTLSSSPGSSRNVMAACIVVAAAAYFVPLYVYADTIDTVTNVHGG
mgnify:CR=1 FL=1